MDYQKLHDILATISTQIDEINFNIAEIKETNAKQRNEELLKRLEQLESSMKKQHLKLDALSAVDLPPTIMAPTAPATVKVAGTVKAVKKRDDNVVEAEVDAEPPEEESTAKTFSNITEYFKFLFVNHLDTLYEKDVMTKEFVEKIKEDNKDKLGKKKNELVLQKSIAFAIWKVLPQKGKDIVYSMKNDNANAQQKKNATEVVEESEE